MFYAANVINIPHRFIIGLFSSTMRELTSLSHDGPKWIVLDGDIDPMWIESLNTVMDDNKVRLETRMVSCSHILSTSAGVHAFFFFLLYTGSDSSQ